MAFPLLSSKRFATPKPVTVKASDTSVRKPSTDVVSRYERWNGGAVERPAPSVVYKAPFFPNRGFQTESEAALVREFIRCDSALFHAMERVGTSGKPGIPNQVLRKYTRRFEASHAALVEAGITFKTSAPKQTMVTTKKRK